MGGVATDHAMSARGQWRLRELGSRRSLSPNWDTKSASKTGGILWAEK